jgi:hypothetical protein
MSQQTARSGAFRFQIETPNCGAAIFLLAIRGVHTADCHDPRYTFERGVKQLSEIQLPPFYIKSPPV